MNKMTQHAKITLAWVLGLALTQAGPAPSAAQEGLSPAERLIRQESARKDVRAAFDVFYSNAAGDERNENMLIATQRLQDMGDAAVPFLVAELEQSLPHNFILCAYALGRIGSSEAEAALREAVVQADAQDNEWAETRKAWALHALGLVGKADALNYLTDGHRVSGHSIHRDMTLIETMAVLTAPASVPILHRQLELYRESDDEEAWRYRIDVVKALGRVADPKSLPHLLASLKDAENAVRRAALHGLAHYDDSAAIDGLLENLREEPLPHVRYAAAWSLEQLLPADRLPAIVELLQTEEDSNVRSMLYRIVARIGGKDVFTTMTGFLGRADPVDRQGLIDAIALIDFPATTGVFRAALRDADGKVVRRAARSLHGNGDRDARDALIAQVSGQRWPVARAAMEQLASLGEPRAQTKIFSRLVDDELAGIVQDPLVRERIYLMGDALVALGYTGDLQELRDGADIQRDGMLKQYLANLLASLELLQRNGDEPKRWIETLASENKSARMIAYRRLAELGATEGAAPMSQRFGRVEPDEAVAILDACGQLDAPACRTLVRRVVETPSFDGAVRKPLREMAAWSARRLGGEDMSQALRSTIRRREGLDAVLLLYLALIERDTAIPLIEELLPQRLRFVGWRRGQEMDSLLKVIREVQGGRPMGLFDLPPQQLKFARAEWPVKP